MQSHPPGTYICMHMHECPCAEESKGTVEKRGIGQMGLFCHEGRKLASTLQMFSTVHDLLEEGKLYF